MKLNGLFLTLCAAILFWGCSDDKSDSPENPSAHAIEFSRIHVNNLSRNAASGIPFSQFQVYGFTDSPQHYLYDGVLVNRQPDGIWSCEQKEYWYPGHDYWFSAVAPADGKGVSFEETFTPSGVYEGGGIMHYRPSENGATLDLLYAFSGKVSTPERIPENMPPVELEFNHLLSQIHFEFHNELGNPHYFINVPSIVLGNLYSEGTIDLTKHNPQWERAGNSTFWTGAGRVDGIKINNPKISAPLYLLPIRMNGALIQLQTQLFYIYNPEDEKGFQVTDVNTFTVNFPEIDFKPGHSYTLIAHLDRNNLDGSGGELTPISFTIEDNSWHYYNSIDVPTL